MNDRIIMISIKIWIIKKWFIYNVSILSRFCYYSKIVECDGLNNIEHNCDGKDWIGYCIRICLYVFKLLLLGII